MMYGIIKNILIELMIYWINANDLLFPEKVKHNIINRYPCK